MGNTDRDVTNFTVDCVVHKCIIGIYRASIRCRGMSGRSGKAGKTSEALEFRFYDLEYIFGEGGDKSNDWTI